MSEDLVYAPIAELAGRVRSRQLSPRELVDACLARIEELDPRLNAFVTVTGDTARQAALAAEWEIRQGAYRGPLHGIPFALKDIFATSGVRTTVGSKILSEWVPDHDASAYERLRAAGAILLGKTNTHEFAFGATTVNPHFGPTRNPWSSDRMVGGSSGGSAAAVASGMCAFALGSDTGGSIRLPAALTGVVGLKPTYGRVSRFGVFPLSWSQDHVGPLSRRVEDAALVLGAIAGNDPRDPSTAQLESADYASALPGARWPLRLGLLKEQLDLPTDPGVDRQVRDAIQRLEGLGADVHEISFSRYSEAVRAANTVLLAEAAVIHQGWLRERPDDYGSDVRARLERGSGVTAVNYLQAQRGRAALIEEFVKLFEQVDAIVSPTVPVPAPPVDREQVDLLGEALDAPIVLLRNTRLYNFLGLPALSAPCGFTEEGLPVGLQVAANAFDELTALRVAYALESVTEWRVASD